MMIPAMRYQRPAEAIEWLCLAFGFQKHAVYADAEGFIAHAQLTFGNGMIMLGGVRDDEYGRHMKQPSDIGGTETRGVYVVVPDADEVYARAKAAGAGILIDIVDVPYGGRAFTCTDPEGHIWDIGTYNPLAA
jgi:uncharacterized glyoxalase superfamily protein PhnB